MEGLGIQEFKWVRCEAGSWRMFPGDSENKSTRIKQMSRIATDCGNGQNFHTEPLERGHHPSSPASSTTSWSILQTKAVAFVCLIRLIRVLYSVKLTTPVVSLFRRFVARRGWERLFHSLQDIWCTDYTDITDSQGLWKWPELSHRTSRTGSSSLLTRIIDHFVVNSADESCRIRLFNPSDPCTIFCETDNPCGFTVQTVRGKAWMGKTLPFVSSDMVHRLNGYHG